MSLKRISTSTPTPTSAKRKTLMGLALLCLALVSSAHGFVVSSTQTRASAFCSMHGTTSASASASASAIRTMHTTRFMGVSSPEKRHSQETTSCPQQQQEQQQQQHQEQVLSRRTLLSLTAASTTLGLLAAPRPAHATYSAYANREKDWQERTSHGQVQYSNAKQLRSQLRDIVPQNTEASKMFCPNGPSAAVSPLMENRCGDAMALPSVYGRSQDVVGNSIPGFKSNGGVGTSNMVGDVSSMAGGFPKY